MPCLVLRKRALCRIKAVRYNRMTDMRSLGSDLMAWNQTTASFLSCLSRADLQWPLTEKIASASITIVICFGLLPRYAVQSWSAQAVNWGPWIQSSNVPKPRKPTELRQCLRCSWRWKLIEQLVIFNRVTVTSLWAGRAPGVDTLLCRVSAPCKWHVVSQPTKARWKDAHVRWFCHSTMLCLKLRSVLQGKDWQIQAWVLLSSKQLHFLSSSLVDKPFLLVWHFRSYLQSYLPVGIQLATIRFASSVQPNQDMWGNLTLSNPSQNSITPA